MLSWLGFPRHCSDGMRRGNVTGGWMLLLNANRPVPLPLLACYLPGGSVDAVPGIDRDDGDDQCPKRLLIVVPGGLVPDLVGYGVCPIAQPGDTLRECKCGSFGVCEVGR